MLTGQYIDIVATMEPSEFVHSIYLGDRACKSILVDGWAAEVKVQVDSISRVRGETWNYYSAEDLDNGYIIFEGVGKIEWDPSGNIPNDLFSNLTVVPSEIVSKYLFCIEAASCDPKTGAFSTVQIKIYADSIALEAQVGGARIRE